MSEVKVCRWRVESHGGQSSSCYGYRSDWAYREDPEIYRITEMVDKQNYDALAAQRDEGLAREAELREALRIAETYVQTAFARAQQKDKLGRKLPADHPISSDLGRVLAALASPGCTDGEKS